MGFVEEQLASSSHVEARGELFGRRFEHEVAESFGAEEIELLGDGLAFLVGHWTPKPTFELTHERCDTFLDAFLGTFAFDFISQPRGVFIGVYGGSACGWAVRKPGANISYVYKVKGWPCSGAA